MSRKTRLDAGLPGFVTERRVGLPARSPRGVAARVLEAETGSPPDRTEYLRVNGHVK